MLGCASGINRAPLLLELSVPVPVGEVTGHDWFALLLAVAVGGVRVSSKSTVLYRLHGGNASAPITQASVAKYLQKPEKAARMRRGMQDRWRQARAVRDRLDPHRHADAIAVVDRFVRIEDQGFLQRRVSLVRGGYTYSSLIRTGAMLAFCSELII